MLGEGERVSKIVYEFFGVVIAEKHQADMADFVVCRRVADFPITPSSLMIVKSTCRDCGEKVWFDTQHSPHRPPRICDHCAIDRVQKGDKTKPN